MMTPPNTTARINAQSSGGKNVLPAKIEGRLWRFTLNGMGQFDAAEACGKIVLMGMPGYLDLAPEIGLRSFWKHRAAILFGSGFVVFRRPSVPRNLSKKFLAAILLFDWSPTP
ncbi:hypothetical protein LOC68_03305 [Blastopirellula sp. JC732]|uniref:Uncharacterized protein n=1 Tax=Blastopirellula sediminis TaxID=2894196 RepID=A0A9X1MHV6_9BACT|nr:hypothetical protein [Blastopirellula sediminis]MCC9627413.1 hypothetical protein [Blastopirellula sediminis]